MEGLTVDFVDDNDLLEFYAGEILGLMGKIKEKNYLHGFYKNRNRLPLSVEIACSYFKLFL